MKRRKERESVRGERKVFLLKRQLPLFDKGWEGLSDDDFKRKKIKSINQLIFDLECMESSTNWCCLIV